jgi:integrase
MLPLTWKRNVDWKAGVVRIEDSKNGEPREFPFSVLPALKALLERQLASAEPVSSSFVLHDCAGKQISYWAWNDARKQACKAAGVDAIAHDLRRTAVRNLERAGVSRSVAMSLTGHKTDAVYRRYAIVNSAAQREGVAKLAMFAQEGR